MRKYSLPFFQPHMNNSNLQGMYDHTKVGTHFFHNPIFTELQILSYVPRGKTEQAGHSARKLTIKIVYVIHERDKMFINE